MSNYFIGLELGHKGFTLFIFLSPTGSSAGHTVGVS